MLLKLGETIYPNRKDNWIISPNLKCRWLNTRPTLTKFKWPGRFFDRCDLGNEQYRSENRNLKAEHKHTP